jgi:hypothetical protein
MPRLTWDESTRQLLQALPLATTSPLIHQPTS